MSSRGLGSPPYRSVSSTAWAIAALLLVNVALAIAVTRLGPPAISAGTGYDPFLPTLTLTTGVCAWVVGTGLRRGSLLSPYSMVLLILVSIYGIRPLLMPSEPGSFLFYGYSIEDGYDVAARLGFVGTVSFIAGFAMRRSARRQRDPDRSDDLAPEGRDALYRGAPSRSFTAAWLLLGAWLAAMLLVGGGPAFLRLLFGGRSAAVSAALAGVPAVIFALPVVACLTIAVVRFHSERARRRYTLHQNIAYWLIAAAAVIPPSALGTRRFLIPSIVIVLIGALANSWRRRIRPLWVVGGAAAFLALAVFPFVRSAGSRSGGSNLLGAMSEYLQEEGVRGTLNNFFLSYDTEMFNYVAYIGPRLGSTIEYGMGRGTVGEIIAMPIPATISPFPIWNDYLLTQLFGRGCAIETACPVPSIVGVLYSDLSWPGLILGMLLLGGLAAGFERSLLGSSGVRMAVLLLVAGFSVVFARGNSMSQLWYGFQILVVWWVVDRLMVQRRARSKGPSISARRYDTAQLLK